MSELTHHSLTHSLTHARQSPSAAPPSMRSGPGGPSSIIRIRFMPRLLACTYDRAGPRSCRPVAACGGGIGRRPHSINASPGARGGSAAGRGGGRGNALGPRVGSRMSPGLEPPRGARAVYERSYN